MAHIDPIGGEISSFYTQIAGGITDGPLYELHESARRLIDFTTKNGLQTHSMQIEAIRASVAMSIRIPVRINR
jgi:hypothetical protein